MTLTDLYIRAEDCGIDIDDIPLRAVVAVSFPEGWIAINRSKVETLAEEKVLIAHEMGHIETGSFYNIYSKFDIVAKHEKHADNHAIKTLIPYKAFRKAIRSGIQEIWDLAEHFGVTENFIRKVADYYADRSHRVG